MYHHQHHQIKSCILSSRATFPSDRHLFQQDVNVPGESGLMLSTDSKSRLKWTSELHERFVEAVNQLGGAEKATPKTVMRLMSIPGLTLYHLKSHLQKYRLNKTLQSQSFAKSGCNIAKVKVPEVGGTDACNTTPGAQTNKNLHICEAIHLQIEVQQRLHEQLEVQRHLQLRIEAQGKYLQSVLEKAQETLGKQNLGSVGLDAAKAQVELSKFASRISSECLISTSTGMKEMSGTDTVKTAQIADCSLDSCLTSCYGPQKEQEILNIGTYQGDSVLSLKPMGGDIRFNQTRSAWAEGVHQGRLFVPPMVRSERSMFHLQGGSDLSNSFKLQASNDTILNGYGKTKNEPSNDGHQNNATTLLHHQDEKQSCEYEACTELDLNTQGNDVTIGLKEFDLNGLSWV